MLFRWSSIVHDVKICFLTTFQNIEPMVTKHVTKFPYNCIGLVSSWNLNDDEKVSKAGDLEIITDIHRAPDEVKLKHYLGFEVVKGVNEKKWFEDAKR